MNIIFIVHYFPPLNSTGARRVLAFAKYLHRFGHKVSVISATKTAKDGLLSEVPPDYCNLLEMSWFRLKPTKVAENLTTVGNQSGNRSKLGIVLVKLKRWLMKYFGQLADHRLLFAAYFLSPTLPPQVKEALSAADVIISSCPPWTVHVAGLICARRFAKPWIADYRDQFSGNHVFPGNRFTDKVELLIEKYMLKRAKAVIVISSPMQEYYLRFNKKTFCVENGYDEELFFHKPKITANVSTKYIRFLGTVSPRSVPDIFFMALSKLDKTIREQIIVEFYGESGLVQKLLSSQFSDLIANVRFYPIVSYQVSIDLMLTADALLFKETSSQCSHSAKGVLTTKLFEYLGAQKPIFAEIDSHTLAGTILTNSGLCCVCTVDEQEIYSSIVQWVSGKKVVTPRVEYISQYSRERQTKKLEDIAINVINNLG